VNQSLQALEEPDLNTVWIAAREDIFRFFCEAINNVVYHAQPPRGDASWVTVSLSQTGLHCRLAIANDGSSPPELDLADIGVSQGTKTMVEIARDLPGGEWCRFPLASGGLCVELSWLMQFYPGETDP
jgi:glucose-6-phosphate-specific signal transduction histidine kinase